MDFGIMFFSSSAQATDRGKYGLLIDAARYADTHGFAGKKQAAQTLEETTEQLIELQTKLAAEGKQALLVVLQGMDASGKDGAVKHVLSGVGPSGVTVTNFKVPSAEELKHDYLWRHERAVPGRGDIGIHNRSHYEGVLVVRVHPELLESSGCASETDDPGVWQRRFREINEWEQRLDANGVKVVKIFLNLSKEEQRKRFLERIDDPAKTWKFTTADIAERQHWDEYQKAISDMLSNTSTDWAPWHVVPADRKWLARLAVSSIIVDALQEIDPHYPVQTKQAAGELADARKKLVAEGPAVS